MKILSFKSLNKKKKKKKEKEKKKNFLSSLRAEPGTEASVAGYQSTRP